MTGHTPLSFYEAGPVILQIQNAARERLDKALADQIDVSEGLAARLPSLDGVELVCSGLPPWWTEQGNILLARPGAALPSIDQDLGCPPRGALVALNGSTSPAVLMARGERPIVVIGEGAHLPGAWLHCGSASTLLIGDHTASNGSAEIDARNGGLIYVGPTGLWASKVRLQTDDMHAIRDQNGCRVNGFGQAIVVGRHVWLGQEALLMGGARVGEDTVVGARSLVKDQLDANCIYAGAPARLLRSGVTWTFDDLP